jgi:hypothetical protein
MVVVPVFFGSEIDGRREGANPAPALARKN